MDYIIILGSFIAGLIIGSAGIFIFMKNPKGAEAEILGLFGHAFGNITTQEYGIIVSSIVSINKSKKTPTQKIEEIGTVIYNAMKD